MVEKTQAGRTYVQKGVDFAQRYVALVFCSCVLFFISG